MQSSKTPVQAPLRSLDQRMDALRRANEIRVRRAQLKKDLKAGAVSVEEILSDPPSYVETAKVIDILMAVPKFGRVKAARFLNQCRVSQSKTVGGLSEQQRPGERNGREYWFVSPDEFDRRIEAGELLEWVVFPWGQRSGTLRSEIDRIAAEGRAPVLELELEGAERVKRRVPGSVTIFVDAPLEELERRLRERATESAGEIDERLLLARAQKSQASEFDYVVVNDEV